MRGDIGSLTALLIATKGEYSSDDVKFMGWEYTTVLLICLPVFFSFLAYAGILFYEVATKKELISAKPATISTTTSKYADKSAPTGPGGNPEGLQNPPGQGGLPGHQPVDLGQGQGLHGQPDTRPGQGLGTNTGAFGQPGTTAGTQPVAVEKDTTVELYLWEELLLFMAFHLVGLVFCIQPGLSRRGHTALGIVIAWLHLALICAYAFVAVQCYHSDQEAGQSQALHDYRFPAARLDRPHRRPGLIICCTSQRK